VTVIVDPAGPIVLRTDTAEFRLLPSGEMHGALVDSGRPLTLLEPGGPGDAVEVAGASTGAFVLDFAGASVTDVRGRLGAGKRMEVRGRSAGPAALEKALTVEVYADFPNLAVSTTKYRNVGTRALEIERVVQQRHRLSAALVDAKAAPFQLWSFHGASTEWGQDEVLPLARGFSRANVLGAQNAKGFGGGVPVVAFWTAAVGAAVGHLEPEPLVASLPVEVEADGRVAISLVVEPRRTLQPGEEYRAPRSFLAVHSGDFYAPLRS
jgi:alpha-galactosidase